MDLWCLSCWYRVCMCGMWDACNTYCDYCLMVLRLLILGVRVLFLLLARLSPPKLPRLRSPLITVNTIHNEPQP